MRTHVLFALGLVICAASLNAVRAQASTDSGDVHEQWVEVRRVASVCSDSSNRVFRQCGAATHLTIREAYGGTYVLVCLP